MTTILVDADFIDGLVFELTVNFERMLERRVDKLDLVRWADYLMLDAQNDLGPIEAAPQQPHSPHSPHNSAQVIFLYSYGKEKLKNCLPASLPAGLNGQATQTRIAEYLFAANEVAPKVTTMGGLFGESMGVLLRDKQCPRLLLVGDADAYGDRIRQELRLSPDTSKVLLFSTGQIPGFHCRQEMLSYSLMAAMGIRGEELAE